MFSNKPKGIEKLNSLSDCLNGLMDNLQKKKNHQDRNFKLNMSLNSINLKNKTKNIDKGKEDKFKERSKENRKEKETGIGIGKIKGLSLEKIQRHNLNFDKKFTKIMREVSPKAITNESNKIKNANLWDLKLKNNILKEKESSKAFQNFKMRLVYNQEENQGNGTAAGTGNYDEQMLFIKNIKRSSSSDFFKTTSNSENKTFSSSRNSFNPMPYYSNSNFNYKDNTDREREREREKERNENISFYSFKSISSGNHNIKKNSDSEFNLSPRSSFHGSSFANLTGDLDSLKKTKRVNFDYFNSIGENPFKINIYDKNSALYSQKKYSKYPNIKEGFNLSPKNIYSPWKYSNNNNKSERYSIENKNMNSKQFTMKKIDNLLKNFKDINSNTITNHIPHSRTNQGSFLNKNEKSKRLYSFINK